MDSKTAKEIEEFSFRDNVSTIGEKGKRNWVFPKKPKGRYYEWRKIVSYILLAIFFVLPFLKMNGNQMFMFNILERKFFLFGKPFFPQDLFLLAIGLITTIVFIVLFTVVYGRIFCGWVCPQTIFLEMVFRRIEYAIDGDRNKQIKLSKQAWNSEKIRKRILKWTIYFILSFIIANFFMAWIVGIDQMKALVIEGPNENWGTFLFVLGFTGVFYFVFTWFREQACTLVCPYGRLQGVLIDKKTMAVAYDHVRGESTHGRAKFKRGEDREAEGKGDCIDCGQCVVVCPTGIDIRNGTQLECVNCTACMDACDEIMTKIEKPTGLIRYASEDNIVEGTKFKFDGRVITYSIALLILIIVTTSFLMLRPEVSIKFLKTQGMVYEQEGDTIINQYQYIFINKTIKEQVIDVDLKSHKGRIVSLNGSNRYIIPKSETIRGEIEIRIHKDDVKSYKNRIVIEAKDDKTNQPLDTYEATFAKSMN